MEEKKLKGWEKKSFVWLGLALIALPVLIFWFSADGTIKGLGTMATVTLITSTIGFFLIESYDKSVLSFGEGEIRKGITFSVIVLFFGLLAFGNNITITEGNILSKVLENFWVIVSTVIAFYFGSRAAEKYAEKAGPAGGTTGVTQGVTEQKDTGKKV